ncbi:unnamed protein product [Caenorhabditis bovis]|uniref:Uncharacterized protein n=1 Tax=Caenorhabditis bovis TaxID=2654633 RepID=A0A8S1EH11_9PELO|nr:unnamed protein product [Caenorhabditis bovis]
MIDRDLLYLAPHATIGGLFLLSVFPYYIKEQTRIKLQIVAHTAIAVIFFFVPAYFLKPTFGLSYQLWKCRNYGRPEQAMIFARLITSFIFLIAKGFAIWHLTERKSKAIQITDNFLYCTLLTDATWFLSEFVRMYRNKRCRQEEIDAMIKRTTLWVDGKGKFYFENAFYVDAGLTLTYAIIHFAFPQHVLQLILKSDNKLDSHHFLWCRLFGALNLIPAVTSITAKYFTPEVQTAYLSGRLITQSVVFLLNIYGHWVLAVYSANHITAFMISGFFSSFLFSTFHKTFRNYFENNSNEEEEEIEQDIDEKKEL